MAPDEPEVSIESGSARVGGVVADACGAHAGFGHRSQAFGHHRTGQPQPAKMRVSAHGLEQADVIANVDMDRGQTCPFAGGSDSHKCSSRFRVLNVDINSTGTKRVSIISIPEDEGAKPSHVCRLASRCAANREARWHRNGGQVSRDGSYRRAAASA